MWMTVKSCLSTNRSLTSLRLVHNSVRTSDGGSHTDEGINALVDALRNNPSMTELRITLRITTLRKNDNSGHDLEFAKNIRYALPRIRIFND